MLSSRPWTAASPPRLRVLRDAATDVGKATIAGLVVELAKGTVRL